MNIEKIKSIDQYIAGFPNHVQEILRQIRGVCFDAAPMAAEAINYQLPTFKLNGNLVYFGAFKSHIGFFPTASGIAAFSAELSEYKPRRGSVQFPYSKPIPYELIGRIVRFRVQEQMKKAKKTFVT